MLTSKPQQEKEALEFIRKGGSSAKTEKKEFFKMILKMPAALKEKIDTQREYDREKRNGRVNTRTDEVLDLIELGLEAKSKS